MRIYGSIIMAGVLGVALVPDRVRGEEVIEVHSCAPGWIEMGTGMSRFCVLDPALTTPKDGGWSGVGEDGDPGGGGGAEPAGGDPWAGKLDKDEMRRRLNCSKCQISANKCIAQAQQAETTCVKNSQAQAKWRCDYGRRQYDGLPTATVWGCSIDDHLRGRCTGVEGWWVRKENWAFECTPVKSPPITRKPRYECSGPGITNCEASWALSHPGGSTQASHKAVFSVSFDGFSGSAGSTITATYELSPSTGYVQACGIMGNQLVSGCTRAQTACYDKFACTDMP